MPAITHTPPFFHLLNIQQQQSKHAMCMPCKKITQIALCFANFSALMRGGWSKRNFVAPQAGSTALGICAFDLNTNKWSYELVLEPSETIYIDSISPDVARSAGRPARAENFTFRPSKGSIW
jgi:hypothetical protein